MSASAWWKSCRKRLSTRPPKCWRSREPAIVRLSFPARFSPPNSGAPSSRWSGSAGKWRGIDLSEMGRLETTGEVCRAQVDGLARYADKEGRILLGRVQDMIGGIRSLERAARTRRDEYNDTQTELYAARATWRGRHIIPFACHRTRPGASGRRDPSSGCCPPCPAPAPAVAGHRCRQNGRAGPPGSYKFHRRC